MCVFRLFTEGILQALEKLSSENVTKDLFAFDGFRRQKTSKLPLRENDGLEELVFRQSDEGGHHRLSIHDRATQGLNR